MAVTVLPLCLLLSFGHPSFPVWNDAEELEPSRSESRRYIHHSASFSLSTLEGWNLFYHAQEHSDHVPLLTEPGLERVLCYDDHLVLALVALDNVAGAGASAAAPPTTPLRIDPRLLSLDPSSGNGALVSGACYETVEMKTQRVAEGKPTPLFYRRVSKDAEVAFVEEIAAAEAAATRRPLVKLWTTPARFEEMFENVDMNLYFRPAPLAGAAAAAAAKAAVTEERDDGGAESESDLTTPKSAPLSASIRSVQRAMEAMERGDDDVDPIYGRRRRLGWSSFVGIVDYIGEKTGAKDFFESAADKVKAAWDKISDVVRAALNGEDASASIELANFGFNYNAATNGATKPRLKLGEDAFGRTACATGDEGLGVGKIALTCPPSATITSIDFANWGAPVGTCPSYTSSPTDAACSVDVKTHARIATACVGQTACEIDMTGDLGTVFGNPTCAAGTTRRLYVKASCAQPILKALDWATCVNCYFHASAAVEVEVGFKGVPTPGFPKIVRAEFNGKFAANVGAEFVMPPFARESEMKWVTAWPFGVGGAAQPLGQFSFAVGPVPVTVHLYAQLRLAASSSANVTASVTMGASANGRLDAFMKWEDGPGWSDGVNTSFSYGYDLPTWDFTPVDAVVKLHAAPEIVVALWDFVPFIIKPQLYAGVRFDTTPDWATCDDSYQVVYGMTLALAVDDIKIPASVVENIPVVAPLANQVIVGGQEFAKITIIGETPFSVEGCGKLCGGCLNEYRANSVAYLAAACLAPDAAPGVADSDTCHPERFTPKGLSDAVLAVIIVAVGLPLFTLVVLGLVVLGVVATRTARRATAKSELDGVNMVTAAPARGPPPKPGSSAALAAEKSAGKKTKKNKKQAPSKPPVGKGAPSKPPIPVTGLRPSLRPTIAPPKPSKPSAGPPAKPRKP